MERTAVIDGKLIRYWSYHSDKQMTIVMIHGITGSHKGFQYLEPLLSDYHLIVPDLPGFGQSDLPAKHKWTIKGIAQLSCQFVESLGLSTSPVILGHSMGGLVVSAMISQNPSLFGDIILISPVPTRVAIRDSRRPGTKLGAWLYKIGYTLGKPGERLVKSRTISAITTKVMTKTNDKERRKAIRKHHWDNLDYISDIKFYATLHRDTNLRGAIDYVRVLRNKRTLLIVGEDDAVTPLAEENKLASAIKPESYVIISKVGHLIHYEKAAEAAEAIKAFLSHRRSSR